VLPALLSWVFSGRWVSQKESSERGSGRDSLQMDADLVDLLALLRIVRPERRNLPLLIPDPLFSPSWLGFVGIVRGP